MITFPQLLLLFLLCIILALPLGPLLRFYLRRRDLQRGCTCLDDDHELQNCPLHGS